MYNYIQEGGSNTGNTVEWDMYIAMSPFMYRTVTCA